MKNTDRFCKRFSNKVCCALGRCDQKTEIVKHIAVKIFDLKTKIFVSNEVETFDLKSQTYFCIQSNFIMSILAAGLDNK